MTDVRILSEPLGGSPLSLLMQRGEAPRDWLRPRPAGDDEWRRLAAERARDAARDVAFVVGGAYGLDDAVRRTAARSIQLAPWTLPHELARLVLAEQLYRAGTIARGEPYHK